MGQIDGVHHARPGREVHAGRFAAGGVPTPGRLPTNIKVQVAGEAEQIAQHLVGDDVGENSPHVGQQARMVDQRGKHVMLEAGRRRLHPAEPAGGRQQRRRQLAEEGVGIDDFTLCQGRIDHVGDLHWAGRRHDLFEPLLLNSRVNDELHK
jgi:hypothetical protein